MTYEQFENQLQELLDEGRLDEADRLLDSVHREERLRCIQLLATYRALFCGLPGALHMVERGLPASSARVVRDRGRPKSTLSLAGMALAVCLTLLVMYPSQNQNSPTSANRAAPPVAVLPSPMAGPASEVATLADLGPQKRHFTRLAASSFEPLARNVAARTDSAFKSIERLAGTLNPIDDQLAAYREAAPVISTLTRGLLPGTRSLGDAFSVLQESATPQHAVTADPSADPPHPSTTPAQSVG